MQIGDPPTNCMSFSEGWSRLTNLSDFSDSLLIDTGSSNTWVGANLTHPYKMSLSTMPTQNAVVSLF